MAQAALCVIGIVGDRNPANRTHLATEAALEHAQPGLSFTWIATEELAEGACERLGGFSGLLIAPGSPYNSMEGALGAIRFARENSIPLLGTCGGFQHIVVEFARNVLGIADADHAETSPDASHLAITPLTCSLAGQTHPVRVLAGTFAARLYGQAQVQEPFYCNYGLNPELRPALESRGLRVSGLGEDGLVRILELSGHPFFVGTLYVPQARSQPGDPHPLVAGLVAAARERAGIRV